MAAVHEFEGAQFLFNRVTDEKLEDEERDKIFEALYPSALGLATEAHASTVLHKLLERVTEEQAAKLAEKLKGEIFTLSQNKFACRVVQKVFETVPEDLAIDLSVELKDHVIECVKSMHGNHVIQICVKALPQHASVFILDSMLTNIEEMSAHMYGIRVLQRLVERYDMDVLDQLLDKLLAGASKMAKDKHGNYIIQSILKFGRRQDKSGVIKVIRDDFVTFAKDKVASNVVERCFEMATDGVDAEYLREDRQALYNTVLGDPEKPEESPLNQLMHDRFGNYTVQCVIKHSRGDDQEMLKKRINGSEEELKQTPTGRHVIHALQKALGLIPEDSKDDIPIGLRSRGSLLHALGQCKPCAWFWKPQGCHNEQNCQHCHLCPEGELKERKKAKRQNRAVGGRGNSSDDGRRGNSPPRTD